MKNNRKIKRIILCICLLSIAFVGAVIPTAASKTIISAQTVEGTIGNTVHVPIFANGDLEIVSLSIIVSYDTEVFKLKEVIDSGLLQNYTHTTIYNSPYYLTWENDTETENFTVSGTLVELVFEVAEDAEPGEYQITINAPEDGILDCNGDKVTCSFVDGAVIISEEECAHEWSTWQKSSNAKHKRTCALCAEAEYENHDWDDGEITEEPTEDEPGLLVYTCSICSGTKAEIIPVLPSEPEDGGVSVEVEGDRTSTGASVAVDVINNNSTALTYHVISAAYDSSGRLIASDVVNKTVGSNSTRSQTLFLTTTKRIVSVKLFLLDENYVPLKPATLVTLN